MPKKQHKALFIITKSIYRNQWKLLNLLEAKAKAEFEENKEKCKELETKISKRQRILTDLALVRTAIKRAKNPDLIKVRVMGVDTNPSQIYMEVAMTLERAGFYVDADYDDTLVLTWS